MPVTVKKRWPRRWWLFEELPPEAQERAIQEWRSSEESWGPWDTQDLTEQMAQDLAELGLPDQDVRWRLSYSQGDGVALYGSIDLDEYIGKNKLRQFKPLIAARDDGILDISAKIEKIGTHYDHWNTMAVVVEADLLTPGERGRKRWQPGEHFLRLANDLEEHIQEHVKEVSRKLEKMGYDEIEYRTSDEYIRETFEANEIRFNWDGSLFRGKD